MINLVLITSIIRTSEKPLSYAPRSVFNHMQRFQQTQLTIKSIKEKIPNCKILLVECSELNKEEIRFFSNNCDYVLNLYDNKDICENINSESKSLGEGTMTLCAIEFIISQNIVYDNLIKISGRYWLSSKFNYDLLNNNDIVIKYIDGNINNVCTALYKLPQNKILYIKQMILSNLDAMRRCIGYEVLFAFFIRNINDCKIIHLNFIGIEGYISVSGELYSG